jgi:hypothetical protein
MKRVKMQAVRKSETGGARRDGSSPSSARNRFKNGTDDIPFAAAATYASQNRGPLRENR